MPVKPTLVDAPRPIAPTGRLITDYKRHFHSLYVIFTFMMDWLNALHNRGMTLVCVTCWPGPSSLPGLNGMTTGLEHSQEPMGLANEGTPVRELVAQIPRYLAPR